MANQVTAERDKSAQGGSVVAVLNSQLADWSVLYVKLHDYHWNVKGPNFYTLHVKFEELYNEASLFVDAVAERILALGGKPVSTIKAFLEQSKVTEASGSEDATAMVRSLADDFAGIADRLGEGAALADEAGDPPTADLLITRREEVQKHLWMLRAFLG